VTAVLTDTVGFIRKLPHDLVAPFRSTLEEAIDADLVLHVADVSHPAWEEHVAVGHEVLDGLGVDPERVLVVLNKIDLLPRDRPLSVHARYAWAAVSAATGEGVGELKERVRTKLLSAPDVAILRVPLEQPELVRRAVALPHQLARRFLDEAVELAMRVDVGVLEDAGLVDHLIPRWSNLGDKGGG